MKFEKPPEYEYAAYKPCGCLVGLCADLGDKDTAQEVARWIKAGCHIERFHRSKLQEVLGKGFGCDCEEKDQPSQLGLFDGVNHD